jgi:hypothetical protein
MKSPYSIATPHTVAWRQQLFEREASRAPEKAMCCAADLLSVDSPGHWHGVTPYLPKRWHYSLLTPKYYVEHEKDD